MSNTTADPQSKKSKVPVKTITSTMSGHYDHLAGTSRVSEPDQRPVINTPEAAAEILIPCFCSGNSPKRVEELWLLPLDTSCHLIGKPLMIARGDVDGCDVPIRSILRAVLSRPLAVSFVVSHNHPTGSLVASAADVAVTRRISNAALACDLKLSDHVIIAGTAWTSIRRSRPDAFG